MDKDFKMPKGNNNGLDERFTKYSDISKEKKRLATTLAHRIIEHARNNMYPKELCCPDCGYYPIKPITGRCGHTRCLQCIELNGDCPCGGEEPEECNTNVMVETLVSKMLATYSVPESSGDTADNNGTPTRPVRRRNALKIFRTKPSSKTPLYVQISQGKRYPVTVKMRFDWIVELATAGRYKEAIPHIAILAAQMSTCALELKRLLAQIICYISEKKDPRYLTLQLYKAVRMECAIGPVHESDMECVICYNTLRLPVTTPCGHTFCRSCLRRAIDSTRCCALCRLPLRVDLIKRTADTQFITTALISTGRKDTFANYVPDYMPVFNCSVAYPTIPCQLLIFKSPTSWRVIKWILEFGERKFGIIFGDPKVHTIGTIVEVKDCIKLEDGRCICTTVGLSRFRILEMIRVDGCNLAEITDYEDLLPSNNVIIYLVREMAQKIMVIMGEWLENINPKTLSEIKGSYGDMPFVEDEWWKSPNGPKWLWWVIAILPITDVKFKERMLATNSLTDRILNVTRVLEKIMSHTPKFVRPLHINIQD